MATYTPLRYPGGKAKLAYYLKELITENFTTSVNYVEPFVGGAGLALNLLFSKTVNNIYLNDNDRAIWAFWYCVLNHSEALIERIQMVDVSIPTWRIQKAIYLDKENADVLDLGFATLFLNRTNRSGIIKANPIGGLSQSSDYKIDCRFNRTVLVDQIQKISLLRDKIHLSCEDAKVFIERIDCEVQNLFFYLDPPYVKKGYQLYNNSFKESDHESLKVSITQLKSPWFVTYDDCELVENLYFGYKQRKFDLNYSVQTKRVGTEIAIYSNELEVIPDFR